MLTNIELKILDYIINNPNLSSSEIHTGLNLASKLVTTKRKLSALTNKNYLSKVGIGRATKYVISREYKLIKPIDIGLYFEKDINNREINEHFNFELLLETLPKAILFDDEEIGFLKKLQKKNIDNISTISNTLYKKAMLIFYEQNNISAFKRIFIDQYEFAVNTYFQ